MPINLLIDKSSAWENLHWYLFRQAQDEREKALHKCSGVLQNESQAFALSLSKGE